MRHRLTLTITSVLSVLLFTVHWADDVARGIDKGGASAFWALVVLAVFLYGALFLVERRAGLVIILLASALGLGIPVLHMRGIALAGGRFANPSGAFFWVWTLLALGVTAALSVILAGRALWNLRQATSPPDRGGE
jgi:hypothetical protein